MSTATLTLDPVDSAALEVRPRRIRRTMSPQHLLQIAMEDSDQWVVEMEYSDSKGKRTRRTISPVRFTASDRFLGLCLCREEPRQFHLARCSEFRLIPAGEVIMPVEMVELS